MILKFYTTVLGLLAGFLVSIGGALAEEPGRVVVLGDSIAAGYGIDPEEAYPALLQKKIDAAGLPFTVVNAGQSGDTTAGGLRRIDWILKQPVSVLIIELGGNDGLRGLPVGDTRTNLQAIINRTRNRQARAKIVIAGMRMPANMGVEYTRDFEKAFSETAQKNGATLIPFLLEGIAGDPNLNQPDRIHPTPEGHKIVAETVWKTLEPVLRGSLGTENSAASASPASGGIRKKD